MAGAEPLNETDIVTKLSPRSVADPVLRLTTMISAKGMKLFCVIDQGAEARQAGLQLRDTMLVIFGSPAGGTPVMVASPLAALDLPLKVLVWADEGFLLRSRGARRPSSPRCRSSEKSGRHRCAHRRARGSVAE